MPHPDVLLVGWDDVGQGEAGEDVCPNLAAFRLEAYEVGLAFSHPVCSQSRQAILFGCHGKKLGTWKDIGSTEIQPWTPPGDLLTLPQVMLDAGYQTALIGKWHCGPSPSGAHWAMAPIERGYQAWRAGTRLNLNSAPSTDYRNWQRVDADVFGFEIIDNETTYATQAQIDEALAWWASHDSAPRFMHVAFNAPHGPFHVPPVSLLEGWPVPAPDASNRKLYRAMLRSADTAFGDLLSAIEPETAVFLYSDNGTANNALANGSPWQDRSKETTFDGGVRVLMLGRWGSGGAPVGLDVNRFNHLVDIPAGICAASGVPIPSSWDSKPNSRNYILSEAELSSGDLDRLARTKTYALRQITSEDILGEELYDLVADPFEESPLDLDALDSEQYAALQYLRNKLAAAEI